MSASAEATISRHTVGASSVTLLRLSGVLAYACASILLVVWCSQRPFARQGDAWEYLATAEALANHGSADIRPGDVHTMFERVDLWRPRESGARPAAEVYARELDHGFVTAPDGAVHARHFWMYSLFAVPAHMALEAVGAPAFNALIVTNAWMLAAALALVLLPGAGTGRDRLTFAALLLASPVVWYVTFTGVEVFSWSLVIVAVVALDRQRHGTAAFAAGLAATQNPPLVLLAGVPVLLALRRGRRADAVRALAGASIALLPVAWTEWHFGEPILIAATIDVGRISLARTATLIADLNVGLIAYAPWLLIALPLAVVRLVSRRDAIGLAVAVAMGGVALAVQSQLNWNTDGRGLMRYLLWMLPAFTWLVFRESRQWWRTGMATAAIATTVGIAVWDPPRDTSWLEHRALARAVLHHAPTLYEPDPEIFTERAVHAEAPPTWVLNGVRDGWRVALPVAIGRASGEVTTLLLDRATLAEVPRRFTVRADYLPVLDRLVGAGDTPFYVHPPAGAVWATSGAVDGSFAPSSMPWPRPGRVVRGARPGGS